MRTPPPHRRRSVTSRITYEGHDYHVTVGFYESGRVAEVFAHGARVGSDMDRLLDDACITMSILIQHGMTASMLLEHLGKTPDGEPSSILGMLAQTAADESEMETEPV